MSNMSHRKSKKIIGAGRLYFEITNALGVPQGGGEKYLGDSPGFALTVESESLEDWSSDGPIAEKDVDVAIRVNRNFTLTTKDISFDNLALFVIGSVAEVAQDAGSVVAEELNGVEPDSYYQLGVSPSNPTGVRGISAVVVEDDTDPTPVEFDVGDDYEVDLATGRIYIVPGGAITKGTNLRIDYTRAANTRSQVTTDNLGAKYGRLRYVEDATFGEPRDVYGPFVQLKPTGELAFKSRDTVQQMGWDVSVQSPPDGGSALYIDGRPQGT